VSEESEESESESSGGLSGELCGEMSCSGVFTGDFCLSRGLESLVGVSEVRSFLKLSGCFVPQPSSTSELESLSFEEEPVDSPGSGC
jgi:hypothetical protein